MRALSRRSATSATRMAWSITSGPMPSPPQNRAGMGVPQPPATASKSVAAMNANLDPLVGGKAIGIPDPGGAQTVGGWQAKDKAPGVLLKQPEAATIVPVPPPTIKTNL